AIEAFSTCPEEKGIETGSEKRNAALVRRSALALKKKGLKMAVAHDAPLARLGLEIGMLCEKLSNLRFDRLGQQRTRAAAQDLCKGIGEGPWLGELDDVTVRHGVSLLHWRSGGVEHHHDTPPYPVTPSPTSGHSSDDSRDDHRARSPGNRPRLDRERARSAYS